MNCYDEMSKFTPEQFCFISARQCGKTLAAEKLAIGHFKENGFIVYDRGDSFELVKFINGTDYHHLVAKQEISQSYDIVEYSSWVERQFLHMANEKAKTLRRF
jgi:predicted AAA+ superfamily ATPase